MANSYGNSGEEPVRGSNPISAHPAFPALVALWFAALLGLGSLVLPLSLFERIISLTGLAEILPPAAPPLGGTAKFAIAFAAALVGCVGGWILGTRLSTRPSAHHEELQEMRRRNLKAKEAREPFQASRELGEGGFDGADKQADDLPDMADSTSYAQEYEEEDWHEAHDQPTTPLYNSVEAEFAEFAEFSEVEPEEYASPSVDEGVQINSEPEWLSAGDESLSDPSGKLSEFDTMGLVQLAERLGQAIEARRAWLEEKQLHQSQKDTPSAPEPAPAAPEAPFGNDLLAAEAEEARMAMAAYFNPSQDDGEAGDRPTIDPVDTASNSDLPSDDGESLLNSLSLPLESQHTAVQETREESKSPNAGQRLSLVSSTDDLPRKPKPIARLKARRRQHVTPTDQAQQPPHDANSAQETTAAQAPPAEERRFDPPEHLQPSITEEGTPAEPAGDRAETERVLRAALEKLQRMSGVA